MTQGIRAADRTFSDGHAANGRLTSSILIGIEHFAVPEPLAPFVTTLYHFTCDEPHLADVIPAGIGYVMVLLSGTARVTFADGATTEAPRLALLTPTSGAAHVRAESPLHLVGAALSPLAGAP